MSEKGREREREREKERKRERERVSKEWVKAIMKCKGRRWWWAPPKKSPFLILVIKKNEWKATDQWEHWDKKLSNF